MCWLGVLIRWTFVLVSQDPLIASHQMVWIAPLPFCLSFLMNILHVLSTEALHMVQNSINDYKREFHWKLPRSRQQESTEWVCLSKLGYWENNLGKICPISIRGISMRTGGKTGRACLSMRNNRYHDVSHKTEPRRGKATAHSVNEPGGPFSLIYQF